MFQIEIWRNPAKGAHAPVCRRVLALFPRPLPAQGRREEYVPI